MNNKLFIAATAFVVVACGQETTTIDRASATSSSQPTSTAVFDNIPGQYPTQAPDVPGAKSAPVGACVSLEGKRDAPKLNVVDCGSPTNGFKVVQRVSTPDQCPKDVDQRFYRYPEDEGEWTACLDLAWSANDCLVTNQTSARRVACDDKNAANRVKPVAVLLGVTDISGCTETGYAHPERKFTICIETQG
ncbi:Uncharacterised protein [Mycobacteroides abscessus subsp. massiliense]|uniref:LppU/SCO3897 family protein n=1 Tax=Mycobacteroides abscessus TaxID=36809 RepID=UPI0009CD1AB5|nr:hypothetical protein [Mycobacteroides abscessus]SKS82197.1 Uncharacterised protein [Mycobacteroides abscessus subsp. massiliense]SKW12187.1 Uncharacterised protein [Mycobacteroides abscessus subsp. massiliense]SKW46618.1 Uncharacterised protein [Mycobacteroides abscessus subsp. massiliense]